LITKIGIRTNYTYDTSQIMYWELKDAEN